TKHILILTPGFPANELDDTCMPYLQTYLKRASKDKYQIKFTVIALQYPYKSGGYLWNGIQVFSCGGSNRPFPIRFYYWGKAWNQLSHFHADNKIDVVHSFWLSECAFLAQKWTALKGVKHVATAMGQDVLSQNRYLNRIKFDGLSLTAVSEYQSNILRSEIGKTAKVIPWGLDKMNSEGSERKIDILGVGSLTTLKRFDVFLDVVAIALKHKPQLNVVLIGTGEESENLKQQAKSLGLQNKLQFVGELPRKEVLSLMKQSKVLLHTSSFESQGFVFNEALATGMAIVSRKVGIADESERWLISESENQMAENVISLLSETFGPQAIIPIKQTVDGYRNLYV
ncbi:MAG: 1,2-diacylglycerol 3-alpha-glucosyltransferase, partial [Granulosicoccus sp.]